MDCGVIQRRRALERVDLERFDLMQAYPDKAMHRFADTPERRLSKATAPLEWEP